MNTGDLLGVSIGKDTLEALTNTIQQQTDPKVFPSLTTTEIEGKTILVLQVDESPIKPVLVQGRGFRRVGRSNHVLSSAELTRLLFEGGSVSWDAGPVPGAMVGDISVEALRQFLRHARQHRNLTINPEMPVPEALEKLDLLY
jgi:ATP-dependent DNA helicase RecG